MRSREMGVLVAQAVKYAHASKPNDFTRGTARGLSIAIAAHVLDEEQPSNDVVRFVETVVHGLPDLGLLRFSPEACRALARSIVDAAQRSSAA